MFSDIGTADNLLSTDHSIQSTFRGVSICNYKQYFYLVDEWNKKRTFSSDQLLKLGYIINFFIGVHFFFYINRPMCDKMQVEESDS